VALSDAGRAALAYWGTIQAGVTQRASTADLWAAIRGAAASEPGGAPLPTIQGVNEVRAAAARIRNASESFGAARDFSERYGVAQGITADMMSTAPWSREQQSLQTLADYQVRFEAQMTSPLGVQFTQTLTALFPNGTLPATTGELIDALSSFAPASGSLGDGEFNGVGDVSILAV